MLPQRATLGVLVVFKVILGSIPNGTGPMVGVDFLFFSGLRLTRRMSCHTLILWSSTTRD